MQPPATVATRRRAIPLGTTLVLGCDVAGLVPLVISAWSGHQRRVVDGSRAAAGDRLAHAAILDGELVDRSIAQRTADMGAMAQSGWT